VLDKEEDDELWSNAIERDCRLVKVILYGALSWGAPHKVQAEVTRSQRRRRSANECQTTIQK
jgi:hypothetical protein